MTFAQGMFLYIGGKISTRLFINFSNSPSSVKVVFALQISTCDFGGLPLLFLLLKASWQIAFCFFITAELFTSMLIAQSEIKKFEEEVCTWLQTERVILDDIFAAFGVAPSTNRHHSA
ncbi:MAG: hypothetical protein IPL16_14615 [Ignavibacteria bacterium]|nr:hypothetical protein [Ignavibacteria bacterium]